VRRERRNLGGLCGEEHVGIDEECIGAVAHQIGEGSLDLAARASVDDRNL
jgi:hypothetical protein